MTIFAKINGHDVQFDGEQWTGNNLELVDRLNVALTFEPRTHVSMLDVATRCARRLGYDIRITDAPSGTEVDSSWDVNEPGIIP